jgi:hypothetical protein
MSCDETHFFVTNKVEAYEGEELVSRKESKVEVARELL